VVTFNPEEKFALLSMEIIL